MTNAPLTKLIQPYLFFEGRCEEAVEFYRNALGAEQITLSRWKESPDSTMCAADAPGDKIMHASFRVGETTIMASDGRCDGSPSFQGFALSLSLPDEDQAKRSFEAVGAGGRIIMPLTPTFYAKTFGMVADRFGVTWMIIVPI